ncbi:thiol:disulfide interchange protein precursor [Planctomycetes bacterium Poly30]|uniref:Thiol:disulfide interchange protein n=1 Tax=Saltatorellus ferox TaxID=2528018 RepID=A0A518EZJ5_9BACT|nr:thiol:disulfide interchange protein precursor [Planctomycetes bacterium Poly30]
MASADELHVVDLTPRSVGQLGWSAKGVLERVGEELTGVIDLGPDSNGGQRAPVQLVLFRSDPSGAHDRLRIDTNRDGTFQAEETMEADAKVRNGKVWTSFGAMLDLVVSVPARIGEEENLIQILPYPIHLWHVFDPSEPDADPILRWSARGWMEGQFESADGSVTVTLAELELDSIYRADDRWALGRTEEEAHAYAAFRALDDHNWCGEQAWKLVDVHPSGLLVSIQRFDPGVSRTEEMEARDRLAADRRAKRADTPLAFSHDFAAAQTAAKLADQRLFLDFETTWCVPCKQMDALVYVAQDVVDAAGSTVCVKLDGDREKALVERLQVSAYPTLILLARDGKEIRRAVGYQSVALMKEFFRKECEPEQELRRLDAHPRRRMLRAALKVRFGLGPQLCLPPDRSSIVAVAAVNGVDPDSLGQRLARTDEASEEENGDAEHGEWRDKWAGVMELSLGYTWAVGHSHDFRRRRTRTRRS